MRIEKQTLQLTPRGPLGRLALSIIRALPAGWRPKAAKVCWNLGLFGE